MKKIKYFCFSFLIFLSCDIIKVDRPILTKEKLLKEKIINCILYEDSALDINIYCINNQAWISRQGEIVQIFREYILPYGLKKRGYLFPEKCECE